MKAKRLTSSHWQQRPTCPLKPAPSSIPWPSPPKLEAVLQRLLPSIPPIPQPFEAHFPRRYPPSQHTARGASSTRPSISGPPMTSPSSLQARLVTAAPPPHCSALPDLDHPSQKFIALPVFQAVATRLQSKIALAREGALA